ncbi:MAG: TasA family protein [Clostridium sp.]
MNKKKITSIVTAVVMGTMIIVGGTLAWFTDKAQVTNVVTFGNVDIKLTETKNNIPSEDGLNFVSIIPGAVLDKDPTITNIGKADCYIRAKVIFTEGAPIGSETLNVDNSKWALKSDGYYYYNEKVSSNNKVTLFDKVLIPTTLGNSASDTTFNITIEAEAIQSDNFTFDWNSATPWGSTPITAETYVAK